MAVLLEAEHLAAGYGPAEVLLDVNLAVGEGEVVTLLGRNGMGKTTTVRVLMGLLKPRGGAAWVVACRLGKISRTFFPADRSWQSV